MKVLALLALGIAVFIGFMSLATSFVLWEWQWFWESNAGWRLLILLALGGGGASRR